MQPTKLRCVLEYHNLHGQLVTRVQGDFVAIEHDEIATLTNAFHAAVARKEQRDQLVRERLASLPRGDE